MEVFCICLLFELSQDIVLTQTTTVCFISRGRAEFQYLSLRHLVTLDTSVTDDTQYLLTSCSLQLILGKNRNISLKNSFDINKQSYLLFLK